MHNTLFNMLFIVLFFFVSFCVFAYWVESVCCWFVFVNIRVVNNILSHAYGVKGGGHNISTSTQWLNYSLKHNTSLSQSQLITNMIKFTKREVIAGIFMTLLCMFYSHFVHPLYILTCINIHGMNLFTPFGERKKKCFAFVCMEYFWLLALVQRRSCVS